ncbi:glycerol 3-phosphate ABC transporter ATP-binding protein [Tepidamorphus gemmatus]|jgi:sn-glycerol 3-phosphate transport system ATP-binding protein|uniref:Glycerol 3-phosphate ABC transporter ATP-binding protein n=1 Tax=Tepidamorphus gemmatus TaxID=747076 RepID=A0A4R3M5D3_9HYPH|nr:sn-glycerol-3-phosphate ABC transporter ATP-binding protein UgpC [Tepidamorphus gemmatus]TCT06435.1 glycerol 3-phosphate ABC transporter ATP-binding protein [Tepidamorphus gemmatus]
MAEVRLREIRKSFGETAVLKGISTVIPDRAFVVIVGPSGCGKSTMLRLVAGLERADGGTISIGGRDVGHLEPGDRDIAMVFQNYALYPHMSVAENIGFGLSVRGLPRAEIRERVRRAAEILQIAHLLDRRPRQLSGGQRQRVAMGRAIVRNPKVFLFDEPLSNLDAKLRIVMRTEIKRLHRDLGATSIFVTHDQVEAMTLGDWLIVMNNGHIEQEGAPLDIYARPATAFVAAFIGSPPMNLLEGRVDGSGVEIEGAGRMDIAVPDGLPERAWLGIRPEHLEPCAESDAQLRIVADIVEPQGSETIVHGLFGSRPVVARLDGAARVRPGEALPMRLKPGSMHFFDLDSDRRIA